MRKRSLWLGTVNSLEFIQRDSGEIESSEYPCPEPRPSYHTLPITEVIHPSTTGKDFSLPLLDLEQVMKALWTFQWFLSLSGWDGTWCVVLEQSVASRIRAVPILL